MGAVIVRISRVRHRKFGDSVSQSTWAAYSPHLHQGGREALSTPPHPPPRPCPFCLVLERSGEGTRSHHIAGTRQSVPAFTECARAVPVTAALPTKQVAGFLLFSLSLRGRHNRGSGYAASATVGPSPPTRESWVKLGCGGCVRVSEKGCCPPPGRGPEESRPACPLRRPRRSRSVVDLGSLNGADALSCHPVPSCHFSANLKRTNLKSTLTK